MPFSDTDSVQIDEMLDAARRLTGYVAEASADGFEKNELVYDAVCMNLLRIGEGARLLSDMAKAELPDIPWPDIISLRHRIAHGYSHLRATIIWETATRNVPPFAQALAALRTRLD
ncbi:MAG TPA: HepT-like ribonuclease domain-containing protein [Brevundimonas sp.]|nr:HepT-like ribonuclease domain-containing protein [Brevundimonas sp.]